LAAVRGNCPRAALEPKETDSRVSASGDPDPILSAVTAANLFSYRISRTFLVVGFVEVIGRVSLVNAFPRSAAVVLFDMI
jgi:hypothetical protein